MSGHKSLETNTKCQNFHMMPKLTKNSIRKCDEESMDCNNQKSNEDLEKENELTPRPPIRELGQCRAKQFLSLEFVLHLYKSTFSPCIEYCCYN